MYRFMEQEEIEIRQISDIKMLHFYQLGGSDAIAVYYGDNKQKNLCAMDKYYNLLMERVLTLYADCKDKDSIIVEDSAKKLIDEAIGRETNYTSFFNRIGKAYKDKEYMNMPKFAADGAMRITLLPMIKYYLKQLYGLWKMDVDFEKNSNGWNRNCVLKLKKGGETFILPVRMGFQNANACDIYIGNFIHELYTLELHISYYDNRQLVIFECKEMGLVGEHKIDILEDKVKSITTISTEGNVSYYKQEELSEIDSENVINKFSKFVDIGEDSKIYKLPWGGYVVCGRIEAGDESVNRTNVDNVFIEENDTRLCVRYFSYGLVENKSDGLKLRTDGAIMRKIYFGDKHREYETLFLPVGYYSGWDYKEFLENKYYYEDMEEGK